MGVEAKASTAERGQVMEERRERVSDMTELGLPGGLSLEGVSDIILMFLNTHLSEEGVGEKVPLFQSFPHSPVFIDNVFIEKDGSRSKGFDERDTKNRTCWRG